MNHSLPATEMSSQPAAKIAAQSCSTQAGTQPLSPSGIATQPGVDANQFRLGHRSCLDGIRGVAILAVMVAHTEKVSGPLGTMGVDIFFVLSGFLISCLLIEEFDERHSINLKAFYVRRILRLIPALLLMLSVLVTFHWFFSSRATAIQTTIDALIALFYSTNWALVSGFRQPGHTFAHTWTLSIEEQFYLTWPVILLLMLRRTKSRASMLTWLVFSLFLLTLEKVTILAAVPRGSISWINCATECRADGLVVGCGLAIALSSGLIAPRPWVNSLVKCLAWFVAVPGILWLSISPISVGFYRIAYHLTAAIFVAVIILRVLRDGPGALGWFLAQPWLVYIGKVSYGLYLWHYPVFVWVQAQHWRALKELIIEISITCAATAMSFYLLERPFLQLKRNFTKLRKPLPSPSLVQSPSSSANACKVS